MLGKIIMHILVCMVQVRNLAIFLQYELSVVLNFPLQATDVTLELSQCCLITALFDGLATQRSVRCPRE